MINQRFLVSRNKREGYYAGHYRAQSFDYKMHVKAWRWSAWAMSEFYPPVHGR